MNLIASALSIALLAGIAEGVSARQESRPIPRREKVARGRLPAIEFGHEGGNLRPFKIAIYADGSVVAIEGSPKLKTSSISAQEVNGLVRKASNRRFWKSGRGAKRPMLPDFGFVFVKVRTLSGKTTYHHGAQTGPLGELYSQLSALVIEKP